MAAQEALHGLHNTPYVKNEPMGNNGYDYNYAINDGTYANHHYNPYMHYGEPQHTYDHLASHHHHHYGPPHQNGPGPENHHHPVHYPQAQPQIPNPHMNQHHHPHHYGHGMDGGMSLNPPSHYSMMPSNTGGPVYKDENTEDPYSFVDEETGANRSAVAPAAVESIKTEPTTGPAPKKRGRKKKILPEPVPSPFSFAHRDVEPLPLPPMTMDSILPVGADAADGQPGKRKYTKSEHYKQRRRHDRFNGMTEEEVRSRTLPDHLASNLDVVIIGINPGLFAAYKGHHYAGPGNHFWKCLYLAGLVPEPMTADDDFKLMHFGIGFTNMVARATKGSADLTRKEIREGGRILLEKLQQYRPKIAVFNGKGIYEVFSGKKEFTFGKQPECIDGTNTFIWVMPSSSARCAQLPRAMDKVPFYSALKKFRDYLNGLIPEIDENEVIFNDPKIRAADDGTEISEHLKVDSLSSDDLPALVGASEFSVDSEQQQQPMNLPALLPIEDGMGGQVPVKKKRGRPKKIRADGTTAPTPVKQSSVSAATSSSSTAMNGADFVNGQPPKKKRGRPKKIRTDEVRPVPQMMDANGGLSNSFGGGGGSSSSNHSHLETNRGPHSPAPSSYSSMAGHSFVNNQPSVINHPSSSSSASSQQQHSHALDYYGRASSNVGGGPLSGLCNDMSPHQSTSSTPQPATSSPRQLEFDPGDRMREGHPKTEHRATPAELNGDSRHHQMTSPGVNSSSSSKAAEQQHHPPPPRSHPGTPQPMAYRPTPPAVAYHVPNQVKDVASKSLSGLESLVDQIPNMADGEQNQQQQHQQQQQQQQHPNGLHGQQPVAVSTSFGHYSTAPAQPSFSYPSTSFGHYAPHYTTPNGGSFPPNLYNPGGQESVFNRTGTVSYPMSFPTSQMNGRSPAMAAGFPYSSYGQAYPHPPHSGAPSGFSPYNPPGSGGVIGGFHPSTSYAYGTTYAPSYTTTQAAASYLNAAAANHQALDGSRGPSGGAGGGAGGGSAGPKDERNSDPAAFGGY
ncbi:uncharacterized protein LOC124204732 isoform X1 [Daphnia pulex]|uniref:uncharacterized protein LOC124204732 isoform X1 n=1 Tax=Daphnia pulex TaxID=6669 RepID=UPI001EE00B6E|nr:uncharacterized protein LOC124204732 isoform X1 [Daphnia pulex]